MANRIVVDPITRIEGHLRIEVEVKDGKITDAYSHNFIKLFYYVAKLDHLLCVPALVLLYLGLKRLKETSVGHSKTS